MKTKSLNKTGIKAAMVLLAILALLVLFVPAVSAQMLGDVNFDGSVNVLDVIIVQRYILGIQTLTTAQRTVADVNGDGYVNIVDANLLMQYAQGYINSFPTQHLHAPSLIAPMNSAVIEGSSITFQWGAVSGATRYQLEITRVSDGSVFRTVDLGNYTYTTQYIFANDGIQYQWRVRAGNSTQWGYWSGYRSFTNGSALHAPTLGSPADNASLDSSNVSFQWSAVTGATRYQLEVVRVNDGFTFKNVELGNVVSNTQTGFPNDGTQYRWRVRAGNTTGWGAWTLYRHFTSGSFLPAPILTAPTHNSTITGSSVIFSWNPVFGANKYQLEVYRGTEISPYKEATLGNVTSTEQLGFLSDGRQYRWRVRAGNSNGWGAWSLVNVFNSGSLPVAPILSIPAAGANVPGKQITFQWNAVSGANMYEIEIFNEGNGSIFSRTLVTDATTLIQRGFPDDSSSFKWRVKAAGKEGWGPWSGYRSFTNGNLPSGPVLSRPAEGESLNGTRITFEWNTVPGADRYQLLILHGLTGLSEFRRVDIGFGGASRQSDFPNDGSYFRWAVRAGNANGWGEFSPYRTFSNGSPFGYPVLQSPAAYSTQSGTTIDFSWDLMSGASRYNLEVVDVRTGVTKTNATVTSETSSQPDFPNDGSEYKWRVRAGDSSRWGNWSAYRYLINETVPATAPAAPSLLSPAIGATAATETIDFEWSASAGATRYQLQVVRVDGGATTVNEQIAGALTTSSQAGFPNDGSEYMWRVRAGNASQWGAWSFYRSFTNGGPWWNFGF
jgi:hypothetical protein